MLSSLLLYLLFIAGGIFIGSKILKPDREYRWIGRLQTAALVLLIFTMGVRIGADEKVLASIGALGIELLSSRYVRWQAVFCSCQREEGL